MTNRKTSLIKLFDYLIDIEVDYGYDADGIVNISDTLSINVNNKGSFYVKRKGVKMMYFSDINNLKPYVEKYIKDNNIQNAIV